MELFLKQTMQVKDMFSKKSKIYYLVFFLISFQSKIFADENITNKTISYIQNIKFFSASFIQDDGETIAEGNIYIGADRIRVEYFSPTKILIVLDEDKAMYYNYDLDEDEFFNPRNTSAWFFFDIFNNPMFLNDSFIETNDNNIALKKYGENEFGEYEINILFENNPLLIRKIELVLEDTYLILSIFNHRSDRVFDKNFFKLINPSFFD